MPGGWNGRPVTLSVRCMMQVCLSMATPPEPALRKARTGGLKKVVVCMLAWRSGDARMRGSQQLEGLGPPARPRLNEEEDEAVESELEVGLCHGQVLPQPHSAMLRLREVCHAHADGIVRAEGHPSSPWPMPRP